MSSIWEILATGNIGILVSRVSKPQVQIQIATPTTFPELCDSIFYDIGYGIYELDYGRSKSYVCIRDYQISGNREYLMIPQFSDFTDKQKQDLIIETEEI